MPNKQLCCNLSRAHSEGVDVCAVALKRLHLCMKQTSLQLTDSYKSCKHCLTLSHFFFVCFIIPFLCWEHFSHIKLTLKHKVGRFKSSGLLSYFNLHVASCPRRFEYLSILFENLASHTELEHFRYHYMCFDGRVTYHFCDACPSSYGTSLF